MDMLIIFTYLPTYQLLIYVQNVWQMFGRA